MMISEIYLLDSHFQSKESTSLDFSLLILQVEDVRNAKGEGEIKIEMQFMADVKIKCEKCNGKKV